MSVMDFLKKGLPASRYRDGVSLYGDFTMKVYEGPPGEHALKRIFTKRNQITNQGRQALLELMRPLDALVNPPVDAYTVEQGENRIWSLAVGTNTAPPAITDTDTTVTAVWQSEFDFPGGECALVALPPNSYYLAISKIMPTTAGVGSTITEAGVFTRGDNDDPSLAVGKKLYARQRFSPIIKTNVMSILFEWQLGIKIQS